MFQVQYDTDCTCLLRCANLPPSLSPLDRSRGERNTDVALRLGSHFDLSVRGSGSWLILQNS
jgi:hypothetical protein